jgi:hypothetical protein
MAHQAGGIGRGGTSALVANQEGSHSAPSFKVRQVFGVR